MSATFGTSGTGNFSSAPASRPQAMRDLVKLEPKPVFWFVHHPDRWTFSKDEWIPWLTEMYADPGVSNVDKDGNTDLAEVIKRRAGWTVIPWEAEEGGYCIGYDGVAGKVHLSKWQKPKLVAGQTRIESDQDGYWDFCRRLVASGFISIPDPDLIELKIERQRKTVNEWREKAPSSPFHRDGLAAEEALLTRMEAAKERLYAPAGVEDTQDAAPAAKARRARV